MCRLGDNGKVPASAWWMLALAVVAIGAGCAAAKDKQPLTHWIRFFQIRYGGHRSDPPVPSGRGVTVAFTIGQAWGGIANYEYVQLKHGIVNSYAWGTRGLRYYRDRYFWELSDEQIAAEYRKVFGPKGHLGRANKLPIYFFQRLAVEKLAGKPLRPGVAFGPGGRFRVVRGRVAADGKDVASYQNGRTVFLPYSVSEANPQMVVLNPNTPAVQEYWRRCLLRAADRSPDRRIFIDNLYCDYSDWAQPGRSKGGVHKYMADSASDDGRKHSHAVARHLAKIMRRIVADVQAQRGGGIKILFNGLGGWKRGNYHDTFIRTLLGDSDSRLFEGGMAEWRLHEIDVGQTAFWLEKIQWCKQRGFKLLFVLNSPLTRDYDNVRIRQVWLWWHLLADENCYFFAGDGYTRPTPDSYIYHHPLGRPLERAGSMNGLWARRFERGRIVAHITPKAAWDIVFYESAQ